MQLHAMGIALAASLLISCISQVSEANELATKVEFELDLLEKSLVINGSSFDVEEGWLTVPENRRKPDSNPIAVGFYRILSTAQHPGPPVFVLPGGPGSSWIQNINDAVEHPELLHPSRIDFLVQHFFHDLPKVGDVIVVDQRGAGISRPRLSCNDTSRLQLSKPMDAANYEELIVQFVGNCVAQIESEGRDLAGYNVFELVDDVNDLRIALGYEKIVLFAGSFGSQWSFALLKLQPEIVRRFIFWGVEGLDHAFDSPSGILGAMARIYDDTAAANDISTNPGFAERLQQRVGTLDQSPAIIEVPAEGNGPQQLVFLASDLQATLLGQADFSARNRLHIANWHQYMSRLLEGDFSVAATAAVARRQVNSPGDPIPQYLSIDCGLLISAERRAELESDPALATIGDVNRTYNFICPQWPALDVGDRFRHQEAIIETPGLFIHGTWDTSTPIQNSREQIKFFPNVNLIVVERATHRVIDELYHESPREFRGLIIDFLAGKDVQVPDRLVLPTIQFK